MYTPTRGHVTPLCCSLSPLPEPGERNPRSTLLGLHRRHGDVRAVPHWLVGRCFRRLVGFDADLSVGRVVFCRLDRESQEDRVVSTKQRNGKTSGYCFILITDIKMGINVLTEMFTVNHYNLVWTKTATENIKLKTTN